MSRARLLFQTRFVFVGSQQQDANGICGTLQSQANSDSSCPKTLKDTNPNNTLAENSLTRKLENQLFLSLFGIFCFVGVLALLL